MSRGTYTQTKQPESTNTHHAACRGAHLMTKSDLQVGACVRMVTDRWDAPARAIAKVESLGHAGVMQAGALLSSG
jgi:hypothetical protein